jgi:WD40 repeat protein
VIELTGHRGLVVALAYSPDGRTLASASADGTARLWDVATGKLTATLQSPAARAYCVAFASDGRFVAVGFGQPVGLVQIWDVESGERRLSWAAHPRTTRGLTFHPWGRGVATGGDDGEVHLWEVGRDTVGMIECRPPWSTGVPPAALAHSPNGKRMAAVTTRPAAIHVWRFDPDGAHYRSTRQVSEWGYAIAFDADGDRIAVGLDRTIAYWNPDDYRPPTTWPAHSGAVLGVAFTPDGQTLLTGGADGLVKLWDSAGRLRHTFDWKVGDVGAVAFAPDGLTAAAGGDGTILVWDVAG